MIRFWHLRYFYVVSLFVQFSGVRTFHNSKWKGNILQIQEAKTSHLEKYVLFNVYQMIIILVSNSNVEIIIILIYSFV